MIPKEFTTITKVSKLLALMLFIMLPFIGFYLGVKYEAIKYTAYKTPGYDLQKTITTKGEFTINKGAKDSNDPNSFKYELIKIGNSGETKVIYSVVNWFGFGYEVSDDKIYIAIINYSEAMGDETLTIIKNDGQLVKNFGHFNLSQTLVPFSWTGHFYWLSNGIPIGDPIGVIRVDADTLKVDYYNLAP